VNGPVPDASSCAPPALRPGLRFGDYLLLAPLGHGAQSEVWEARPLNGYRRVALKVLAPSLAASAEPPVAPRARGSGRPTKAERRAIDRLQSGKSGGE